MKLDDCIVEQNQNNWLVDSLPCGICKIVCDDCLSIVYANEYYYSMHGYTTEQIDKEGSYLVSFLSDPEDFPMVRQRILENLMQGNMEFEIELKEVCRSGELIWVLVQCSYNEPDKNCMSCVVIDITKQKKIEELLRISEEDSRTIVKHAGKYIFRYNIMTKTVYFPVELAKLLNLPIIVSNVPEGLFLGDSVLEESKEEYRKLYEAINRGEESGNYIIKVFQNNENFVWYSVEYTVIFDKEGTPFHAIISFENITEKREKELEYIRWRQYYEMQMADSIAYYECNLTKNLFLNIDGPIAERLPKSVRDSFSSVTEYAAENFVYSEDKELYSNYFFRETLLSNFHKGKREIQFQHRRISEQGVVFWVSASIQLLPDPYTGEVKGFVLIKNIDKQKQEEMRLMERSQLDSLTKIFNRGAAVDKMTELFRKKREYRHVFMIVDMDNFKQLNDNLGHHFGDMVLCEIANDIKSILEPNDIVGRLGGDEFVICLEKVHSYSMIIEKTEKLCGLLSKSYEKNTKISGSLGISVYPKDGLTFEELYQKADIALYEAKDKGRNQYVFYKSYMQEINWRPNKTPIDNSSVSISIDKEREKEKIEEQDRMLNQYNVALKNTYDELFELNFSKNTYRIVYHAANKYVIPKEQGILDAMIVQVSNEMVHKEDKNRFLDYFNMEEIRCGFQNGRESITGEFRKLRTDGEYNWAMLMLVPMHNENEKEILLCFITDVNEKKSAEELANQNKLLLQRQMDDERYRIIVEQTDTIVLEYNSVNNSYYISPMAERFHFSIYDKKLMNQYFLLKEDIHPDEWPLAQSITKKVKNGSNKVEVTLRLLKMEGEYCWCRIALTIIKNEENEIKRSIITINDVDKAVKDRKSLEYRAEYDDLTGCYNFSKFKIEASRIVANLNKKKCALWYCDFKNFKLINELYGYDFGDLILRYWVKIIERENHKGELFARVSADYFTGIQFYQEREELESRFKGIFNSIENYEAFSDKKFRLEVISGIYCIETEEDILSIEEMINRAIIAKKSIKHLGGSRIAYYTEDMRNRIIFEKEIEADMKKALIAGEFCVFLQPLVDVLKRNTVIGAEALVRWDKPGAGLYPPDTFIPLFEKNGFIVELDAFVFEEVCKYLSRRRQRGKKMFLIAINVSKISLFQKNFADRYIKIKDAYEIPDEILELECTETVVVKNVKLLNEIMKKMRFHGFLFSLDDFGSGYSSLNLLKDITVEVLKLDMVFFCNNLHEKRDQAIIYSILSMARALEMKVVAEGIETEEELLLLQELGCDIGQGYLFGEPMIFSKFEELFEKQLI